MGIYILHKTITDRKMILGEIIGPCLYIFDIL